METLVASQQQYDWVDENLSAVASLKTKLAYQYMRDEGISKGRAFVRASDWIADNLMNPPRTGTELDAWVISGGKKSKQAELKEKDGSGSFGFKIVRNSVQPEFKSRTRSSMWNEYLLGAINAVNSVPLGEWVRNEFLREGDARRASTRLSVYVSKHYPKKDRGWRIVTRRDPKDRKVLWIKKAMNDNSQA